MKLILKEDVPNLGAAGEIVNVKDGYGRNYLVPQKLAIVANEGNLKQMDHAHRLVDTHRKKVSAESAMIRERLAAVRVEITKLAGDEDKLYGSVTSAEIADVLAAQGVVIDKRTIVMPEAIKTLGDHTVSVRLKESEPAEVVVHVVAKEA